MTLDVELVTVRLPLVTPFRTSATTLTERETVLVHARTAAAEGWGECAAFATPFYSAETTTQVRRAISDELWPRLRTAGAATAAAADAAFAAVGGHPMAKAAVKMALLDVELRTAGRPLADWLGSSRAEVAVGTAVGLADSPDELCEAIATELADGYGRVKVKIAPDHDLTFLRAARDRFGPELDVWADGNGSYDSTDPSPLIALDELGLGLIEQPFATTDMAGHARLASVMRTPICLDESITSVAVADRAIEMGACAVINVKPGRVGGLDEAVRIHDLCVDTGTDAWCGGMLESGIGKAALLALSALPGFTRPGDISASHRWFASDLTAPFVVTGGVMALPSGPGIGVTPDADAIAEFLVDRISL